MKSISFATALLLNLVSADQPVHCLREAFFGEWNFKVSTDTQTVNLFDTQQICSHTVPNKIQLISSDHKFDFGKYDTYKINILEGFKAEALYCKGGKTCDKKIIKGKWTMIYDQAMNVELDNGQRFTSNFRYDLKEDVSADPFTEAKKNGILKFATIETSDYDKFKSECNQSMVGFVQNIPDITGKQQTMSQHQATCFVAERIKNYKYEETKEENTEKMKTNKIIAHHKVTPVNLLESESKSTKEKSGLKLGQKGLSKKRVNMHLEHKPSDEMDLMIEAINEADLGWKADVCKYQKHNKLYGAHCDDLILAQTKTINFDDSDEMQTQEEEDLNVKPFGDLNDPNFVKSLEFSQQFQKEYKDAQAIPDDKVPESLDLRDMQGFDYTSDFRDQGHCGSCYTVSFTQVAESRLKLKYGKQPPLISPQMLMTCNYMNEGCDGGWPHFNVFLAQNGHMVSEECAPYLSKTKGDQCKNYEKCQPIAKIQQSYFVGGSWGSTTEKKMMKEILRNGAINGDFQAPSMFSIYKEGIFREKGLLHLHQTHQNRLLEMIGLAQTSSDENESESESSEKRSQKLNDVSLNDKGKIAWMDMNHSVVIIGWGVDKKTSSKYWIVRNSYGPKWGMNGDFLVARGNNDFGMEVEQIAFHPVLCGEDGSICQ